MALTPPNDNQEMTKTLKDEWEDLPLPPNHSATFKSDFLLKALDYTYNYANLGGG